MLKAAIHQGNMNVRKGEGFSMWAGARFRGYVALWHGPR